MLRDVLFQHGPPAALTDYAYLLTAFTGAALSYLAWVEGATREACQRRISYDPAP
jgi:uncharacterized membrane protein YeiH